MDLVRTSIRQPVTVSVGVLLVLLAGLLALGRIPIQLTPNVEDTIVAVTTRWEGASPQEIEQDLIDPQEERLQGITGLERMTSTSQQGVGSIRLEFDVGTPKDLALREVSDKLREVPEYPENVDEPVVEASDPENRDYIAWFIFDTTDPSLDVRKQQDFAEDRLKPVLERVPGVSEVNVLGGRERETQVRFDALRLAQVGIPVHELAAALRRTNDNVSAGTLDNSRSEVRMRMVSQFHSPEQVLDTLIAETEAGDVYVRDVASVVETFKEPTGFVRSRGKPVIAINAQREVGANVMEVMEGLRLAVDGLNEAGGVLDSYARQLGLEGKLTLEQVYDQTIYIDDALSLVQNNIWIGGGLAILVLLLFLRSVRSPAIVALSIPISVVGAVVFLVALGRSVNVISLAGMAFAVGMVVDNAIVVLENIFRHLEMGKSPVQAAYDGAREVFGAVIAATLTTVVAFLPILLIEEEAGQLFRDIALAIVAAVSLSLVVSLTVIPCAAARTLRSVQRTESKGGWLSRLGAPLRALPGLLAGLVYFLCGSVLWRLVLVLALTAASLFGTWKLLPPADYLPVGNRNLVFGLILPPPGMSIAQQEILGLRVEAGMAPFFEAGRLAPGDAGYEEAKAELPAIPTFDFATMSPGEPVHPPPLQNYFLVAFPGTMFHGGIAQEADRVPDLMPLFQHVTRAEVLPGILAFAFQVPLFRLGGRSGSAVEINFSGNDLDQVSAAASSVYRRMVGSYGPYSLQPDPSNFDLPTPELQVLPNLERLGEVGLSPADLGLAVQGLGDGAFLGDYLVGSQTVDLKLLAQSSLDADPLAGLPERPIATPRGGIVPLSAVADLVRVNAPGQINRTGRQRSVSLQFTPPAGMPLGQAMDNVQEFLSEGRANGSIPSSVQTTYSGSASKLDAVKSAMLGDGTWEGVLGSSLVLALLVVYLLMCVLFQSFLRPLIILFSVPLATLGGFAALYGVHLWSESDRYLPVQNLDVLTMLGFVILIGIVVNNAILIVHQAVQFMAGGEDHPPLAPREAIREAVRTRVRPIFMGTLTSVLGMSPLIFMPGAGSELYRGLGSVVVGGLLVSTVFTLLLVPLLLSLVSDLQERFGLLREGAADAPGTGVVGGASLGRALGLLFVLGATLGNLGCTAQPASGTPIESWTADLLRAELERLPEGEVIATEVARTSRVDEVLGERRQELEELGGPGSFQVPIELGPGLDGSPEERRGLSLQEAVAGALESNLGLEVVRLDAQADRFGVTVEEAAFDSVWFASVEGESARSPNRVPIVGGVPVGAARLAQERVRGEFGLRQLLRGGATVSALAFLERFENETDGIDFDPDPAWSSGLQLTLEQPLARGRGRGVTEAALGLVQTQARRSREDLAASALVLAALTEQAYWDLVEAWDALRIRRRLADQGAQVEAVLRERLVFDADPAAYSDALATVQRRDADLLRRRRQVRAASDALKALLDSDRYPLASEVLLEPETAPTTDGSAPALRAALAEAFGTRPELRRAILAIEDAELRASLADDSRRPRLDLVASLSLAGLDDGLGDSFESLVQDDELTALLGLTYEQPSGARAAKAQVREARLRSRRSLVEYQTVVRGILLEVKESLRDLQVNTELLAAAEATRLAETENLRTVLEEERSRSRLTPEFLALKLTRQERLAIAQENEVQSQANCMRARAALRRALGRSAKAAPEDTESRSR